ncbi:MAG: polysaccharide biosynthesis tyrosine autokinase [Bacteroidetes bacterium]|nr:polysaccharide biosynthesis tyrosine autokinase [Bacteroidota bacterium]
MDQQKQITEEGIDVKSFFFKFLKNWYYFIISIFLALSISYLYNTYSVPVFRAGISFLMKDPNAASSSGDLMVEFSLLSEPSAIANEIEIIKSRTLLTEVIKQLDFEVSYFSVGNIRTDERYRDDFPFVVTYDPSVPQPTGASFFVTAINDERYEITSEAEGVTLYNYSMGKPTGRIEFLSLHEQGYYGKPFRKGQIEFTINKSGKSSDNDDSKKYYFWLSSYEQMASMNKARLSVSRRSEESSIIDISATGTNLRKLIVFLNKLTDVYISKNLQGKSEVATNVIKFIDSQLLEIGDSLNQTENELQTFKSSKQLIDLNIQTSTKLNLLASLEVRKSQYLLDRKYYVFVKEYVENNDNLDGLIAPSTIGISEPTLNTMIASLVLLNGKRNLLHKNAKEKNPFWELLNIEFQTQKATLLENLRGNISRIDMNIADVQSNIAQATDELSNVPAKERELSSITRRNKLNESIYTYLLQKKAEIAIARASTNADHRKIDPAVALGQIFPNKSKNYLTALFLGFLFPILIIFLKDFFNDRITDRKMIEKATKRPILGTIVHSEIKNNLVVLERPKSITAESFRAIRTTLQFFIKGKEKQVILLTSLISGEGKTFCSLNLASIFALYNKRTLLLGFDLRRPRIFQDLGLHNTVGLSSYLSNQCELDEIIQHTQYENLDIISAGPVPPNPSELIAQEKTGEMIETLKATYDYIIIDTSPAAIVTDPLLLMKYSDMNIFIVRQDFTPKKVLSAVLEDIEKSYGDSNIGILVNDIKLRRSLHSYGYGYAYNYGYGYGYGEAYGDRKKRKGLLGRLFNFSGK